MAPSVLVVARHNEDIGWINERPPGWQPLVIQTGADLPNGGREPAAFFCAMQRLKPVGTIAFVQADALRHCPGLWDLLRQPTDGFRWLGDTNHSTDGHGAPHHPGLPVQELMERWIGRPFQGIKWFGAGGQFVIPGKFLKRHSKEKYAEMQAAQYRDQDAWCMERLWGEFWA